MLVLRAVEQTSHGIHELIVHSVDVLVSDVG